MRKTIRVVIDVVVNAEDPLSFREAFLAIKRDPPYANWSTAGNVRKKYFSYSLKTNARAVSLSWKVK